MLRQKWSPGQVEGRFANMPPCLIGMEACVGAHHLSRKLRACERLMSVPGVGPIISSAMVAIGVLIKPKIWERHGLKRWIEAARKRLHHNVLAIALANKLARMVLLQPTHHGPFPPLTASTSENHCSRKPSTDFCNKICQ